MNEDEMSFPGLGSLLASPDRNAGGFEASIGITTPPRLASTSTPAAASVATPSPCSGAGRSRGLAGGASSRSPLLLPAGALWRSPQRMSPASCSASLSNCAKREPSPGETVVYTHHRGLHCAEDVCCEPGSPGESRLLEEDSSPGEVHSAQANADSCSSGGSTSTAAQVTRLRDAAAAAMRASCEELAVLRAENERLRVAERAATSEVDRLRRRLDAQRQEIESLHSQLDRQRQWHRRARTGSSQTQSASQFGGYANENDAPSTSLAENMLAEQLAQIELAALGSAQGEERRRLRKTLQLKWHPDKNAYNTEFATRVLQEMQRRPEWQ
eukprot:TRINITY_DN3504_c0_g2_i1.p1 TRINITY_DN3504_c0_g2~~TRINITY_DN3504_c0_g2_i1.p1  ORF type:complete len:345 (+),score=76.52 TRINITY_DN3504_c0_g2_i1:53-1036(+)